MAEPAISQAPGKGQESLRPHLQLWVSCLYRQGPRLESAARPAGVSMQRHLPAEQRPLPDTLPGQRPEAEARGCRGPQARAGFGLSLVGPGEPCFAEDV